MEVLSIESAQKVNAILLIANSLKTKEEQIQYISEIIKEMFDNNLYLGVHFINALQNKKGTELKNELPETTDLIDYLIKHNDIFEYNDLYYNTFDLPDAVQTCLIIKYLMDEIIKRKPKNNLVFQYTKEMLKDLEILLDNGLLYSIDPLPDFKNQYHAIKLFELWNNKYMIPDYHRYLKILNKFVLVKHKNHNFKDAKGRVKLDHEKEILKYLPHLNTLPQ